MSIGEVFLGSLHSGVITPEEINWLTAMQDSFSRQEEATALRIGRLLDDGLIQIGCRLPIAG